MKKVYIASSFLFIDDFLSINLKRELINLGFQVINMDEKSESYYEESKATAEYGISQADIFIAVFKGKSPFVFYELGYATALGKKVLIVVDSDYDLPPFLKKYDYIRFDSSLSSAIYSVVNFLEKTKVEESVHKQNISTFKDLISALQTNPQVIDSISSKEFEKLICSYFIELGAKVELPKYPHDYGYDFELWDWKGFSKTIVEVKKHNRNSKVSVNSIQQLMGAMNMYEADHGIIITTSEFTASTREFANSVDARIELWDIDYLLNQFNLKK